VCDTNLSIVVSIIVSLDTTVHKRHIPLLAFRLGLVELR
jgi:hypothetical protein